MVKRIIIAYNPRSSKHLRIQEEVINPAQKLKGHMVGKFEIKSAPVDENVEALSKILMDGDLLIAAGGDGTATVGVNAVMKSSADVTLGVLGYGNFNDFARTVKSKNLAQIIADYERGNIKKLYPLEAWLDGKLWRYGACYFTIGMFAESTEVFDKPSTRKALKRGKKSLVFSVIQLAKWYFKSRKKEFLAVHGKDVSDVLFVNGRTVAKIMKGGDYWQNPQEFFVSYGRLTNFFRLCRFMSRSMFTKMPGQIKKAEVKIDFSESKEFEIQAEGEFARVKAKELIVKKNSLGLKVVVS